MVCPAIVRNLDKYRIWISDVTGTTIFKALSIGPVLLTIPLSRKSMMTQVSDCLRSRLTFTVRSLFFKDLLQSRGFFCRYMGLICSQKCSFYG